MTDNQTYYIYYGAWSSYIKTASGKSVAVSELTDPVLPWKRSYFEVTFSLTEKYVIHLPVFGVACKISLNGSLFLTITGKPAATHFCYSTVFENQLIEFIEIEAGEKYELYVNQNIVGSILYYPFLSKDLLTQNVGTRIIAPVAFHKPAILFALWKMDYSGPLT